MKGIVTGRDNMERKNREDQVSQSAVKGRAKSLSDRMYSPITSLDQFVHTSIYHSEQREQNGGLVQ